MVSNKSRLLRLYRYLYINTDDKHYTTKNEIMNTLKDEESIYSRQTVRNDIDTLAGEGYDIETVVSSGNYYYFRNREFTLDELRMMSDAVASSRFIGKKQKAVIQEKLRGFCSKYQAEEVKRHLVCVVPPQYGDSLVCSMVDIINDAINQGRKISFQLGEPGTVGRRRLVGEGENFICTPFDLAWDGRDYHLVCWSDKNNEPALYPVKLIVKPVILKEEAMERPAGFKSGKFAADSLRFRRGQIRVRTILTDCPRMMKTRSNSAPCLVPKGKRMDRSRISETYGQKPDTGN